MFSISFQLLRNVIVCLNPFLFPYQGSESPKMVWNIEEEPAEGSTVNSTAEVGVRSQRLVSVEKECLSKHGQKHSFAFSICLKKILYPHISRLSGRSVSKQGSGSCPSAICEAKSALSSTGTTTLSTPPPPHYLFSVCGTRARDT